MSDTISIERAIEVLTKHQEWRRYNGPMEESPEMQNPTEIGIATDLAIKYLELQQSMMGLAEKMFKAEE